MEKPSPVLAPWRTTPGRQPESLWGAREVSRRSGELTPLFVFRYVGPHTSAVASVHDCWEFLYVFRGKGILHVGLPYPLKTGRAYLMPPRTPHLEASREPMDTLWIGLKGRRLRGQEKKGLQFGDCAQMAPLLEQIWLCAERPYSTSGPELDGLVQAALAKFLHLIAIKRVREHDLLDHAVELLHREFQTSLRVTELAARLGFSEGYFFRAFKRRTGCTPVQYLTRLRIEHALKLLRHSSLSVSRVARLVGYRDPLYFSRIFKRLTGGPPSGRRQT
jgi:AraC-like DNA-binding protein